MEKKQYSTAEVINMVLDNFGVNEEFTSKQMDELAERSRGWFNNRANSYVWAIDETGEKYIFALCKHLHRETRHVTIQPASVKWYNELLDLELYAPTKPAGKGWTKKEETKERGYNYYVYSYTAEQAEALQKVVKLFAEQTKTKAEQQINDTAHVYNKWMSLYHKYLAKAQRCKELADKAAQRHNEAISKLAIATRVLSILKG